MPRKQQVTRVGVDEDTWRAFRQLALDRGLSVSTYLATLVEAELGRRGARPAVAVTEGATDADKAIVSLAEVRSSIDQLDAIAGRLARSATAHGASWRDVGSSLRLSGEAAREAYGAT